MHLINRWISTHLLPTRLRLSLQEDNIVVRFYLSGYIMYRFLFFINYICMKKFLQYKIETSSWHGNAWQLPKIAIVSQSNVNFQSRDKSKSCIFKPRSCPKSTLFVCVSFAIILENNVFHGKFNTMKKTVYMYRLFSVTAI